MIARADGGVVTSADVFAAFPMLEPETAQLVEIQERLRARGIEWVDEITEELHREEALRAPARPRARRSAAERLDDALGGRPRPW